MNAHVETNLNHLCPAQVMALFLCEPPLQRALGRYVCRTRKAPTTLPVGVERAVPSSPVSLYAIPFGKFYSHGNLSQTWNKCNFRTLARAFVSYFVYGHLTLKEILDQISYQLAAVSREYRAVSILRDMAHTVFMVSTQTAPLRDLLALPGNREVLQIFERIGIRDAASFVAVLAPAFPSTWDSCTVAYWTCLVAKAEVLKGNRDSLLPLLVSRF